MKILFAGVTGVIGRSLAPLLIRDGHDVIGLTRSAEKVEALRQAGVRPVIADVFDAGAVGAAVSEARPDVVMHQLTDLPQKPNPADLNAALARNAHLRVVGTRNLVDAAIASGVPRMIAQSIAFAYAPGPQPYTEDDPLDISSAGARRVTIDGVVALEQAVLNSPPLSGIVLRYGRLYGPGTWTLVPQGPAPLHVAAAAAATVLALNRGKAGIYNIAEDDGAVSIAKARRELGFDPDARA